MADNVRRLPAETVRYFIVDEWAAKDAVNGELDSWYSYDSLEGAEEAARESSVEMTVLEVKIKPVSITRKVTEVERL